MKTLTVEEMIEHLATRGLVQCEHNLMIWQCPGGEWGAAILASYPKYNAEVLGDSLRDALETLMRATNRGSDVNGKTVP